MQATPTFLGSCLPSPKDASLAALLGKAVGDNRTARSRCGTQAGIVPDSRGHRALGTVPLKFMMLSTFALF